MLSFHDLILRAHRVIPDGEMAACRSCARSTPISSTSVTEHGLLCMDCRATKNYLEAPAKAIRGRMDQLEEERAWLATRLNEVNREIRTLSTDLYAWASRTQSDAYDAANPKARHPKCTRDGPEERRGA